MVDNVSLVIPDPAVLGILIHFGMEHMPRKVWSGSVTQDPSLGVLSRRALDPTSLKYIT
jgi:hypothetical protein